MLYGTANKLDWKQGSSVVKGYVRQWSFSINVLQETSVYSRLGIIYNPTSKIDEESTAISRGILAAFLTQRNNFLRNFLMKLTEEETATAIYSGAKIKTFLTEVSRYLFEIIIISVAYFKSINQCAWSYHVTQKNQ